MRGLNASRGASAMMGSGDDLLLRCVAVYFAQHTARDLQTSRASRTGVRFTHAHE